MSPGPKILLLVGLFQLASAATFAAAVRHPVFDEVNYDRDVTLYEQRGVSIETLRAHQSASAPMMTILAGTLGRLSVGDIRYRRLAVLLAWCAALVLAVWLAVKAADPALTMALLLLFCFPHTPTSMGSLLTEGPTTAFVLAGLMATIVGCCGGSERAVVALASGCAFGLAILARQYAMAMAGGATLAWLLCARRLRLAALASLGTIAALGLMWWVWGGLTSPASHGPNGPAMHSIVALNVARPLAAMVYLGLYVAPLVRWDRTVLLGSSARTSLVLSILVVLSGVEVWGNGPILSVLTALTRGAPWAMKLVSVPLVAVAFAALGAVGVRLWTRMARSDALGEATIVFAAGTTILFVLEQLGVGGTIPFFERYTFLAFPWAAYLALRAFDVGAINPWLYGGALAAAGQLMLWRHAWG